MAHPFEILVVSSDTENRSRLSDILASQGMSPTCVSSLQQCYKVLSQKPAGLVFCDPRLPDGSYRELLSSYRVDGRKPRVVLTSPNEDWEEFKKAVRLGAFDVISVPCRPADVEWMVIQAKRDERERRRDYIPPRIPD